MSLGGLQKYPAAIALDNDFANAYYNQRYVYQQLGKYSLALTNFDRALTLTNGSHFCALINRSSIYALQKNYQLALGDLRQAKNYIARLGMLLVSHRSIALKNFINYLGQRTCPHVWQIGRLMSDRLAN